MHQLIGHHAAGTAVRCMSAIRLPGPADACDQDRASWLLVTAGAKEVHMAWMLRSVATLQLPSATPAAASAGVLEPSDSQRPDAYSTELTAKWLATLPPPKGGLHPKQNAGFTSADGERRTMALCAFYARCTQAHADRESPSGAGKHPPMPQSAAGGVACVVSASSCATMRLSCVSVRSGQWEPLATLRQHARPVLSIAHCQVGDGGAPAHRVVTGCSDGCVELWDVSAAVERACAALSCHHLQAGDRDVSTTATALGSAAQHVQEVQPELSLPGHHQSGVNAIAMRDLGAGLLVVSGGDDQALQAVLLCRHMACSAATTRAGQSERCSTACLSQVQVDSAHASAIKGLASCKRGVQGSNTCCVASVGLDQVLRIWSVSAVQKAPSASHSRAYNGQGACKLEVACLASHACDVCEPSAVAGHLPQDAQQHEDEWWLAVAGRGMQMFNVMLPRV